MFECLRRIVIAGAIAAACGAVFSARAYGSAPASPALAACPAGESISVNAPSASAPTSVTVAVTPPLNLKAAKENDPASYHLHYFVDIDPATTVQAGQPVPAGNPRIIHSAAITQDVGPLATGRHIVWVVLGDVGHTVCNPIVQGSVSFDVGAAALPASGTGGPAAHGGTNWPLVAAAMLALGGVVLVRAAVRRSRAS